MTGDAECVGGLVSTDWRGLVAYIEIEVASDGVGECCNTGYLPCKIVSGHEYRLF
jgi:hypothetical protein